MEKSLQKTKLQALFKILQVQKPTFFIFQCDASIKKTQKNSQYIKKTAIIYKLLIINP